MICCLFTPAETQELGAKMKSEHFRSEHRSRKYIEYGAAIKLDKKDKIILKTLEQNSRASIIDIAKKTNLTRDVVAYRIQKLIDQKVIFGFSTLLNPPKMGYPVVVYVCFALERANKQKEERFVKYLMSVKNVSYVASITGRWDYIIDIMAKDHGHMNDILKEIRHTFSEIIKEYEVMNMIEEHKYEEIAAVLD